MDVQAPVLLSHTRRLFLPSTSDDASHNEALSSRIAALNMLDLGLEHLDIDIGDANQAEVDTVVRECGQSRSDFVSRVPFSPCIVALAQLDPCSRSPRDKAEILVSAHKLVVGQCGHHHMREPGLI